VENKKELSQMSDKELWRLFPIILSDHNPEWKAKYIEEERILKQRIGDQIIRIDHIGSTAVPKLIAKPTIDILIQIKEDADKEKLICDIESLGYIYSPQPGKPAPHMMFMKGYTFEGFHGQVFHLHVRHRGDWDELYFRKYLQFHPNAVEEYGKLKLLLKEKYEFDRDAYTNAKTEFIKRITDKARKEMTLKDS